MPSQGIEQRPFNEPSFEQNTNGSQRWQGLWPKLGLGTGIGQGLGLGPDQGLGIRGPRANAPIDSPLPPGSKYSAVKTNERHANEHSLDQI